MRPSDRIKAEQKKHVEDYRQRNRDGLNDDTIREAHERYLREKEENKRKDEGMGYFRVR